MQEPVLKSVHQKMGDKVSFLKVDVDKNPEAASHFQIRGGSYTYYFLKNGEIKWRHSGVVTAQILEQVLHQNL
jgi:thioredoxin 1